MKNLYRRYRPLGLDAVIGQEQVTVPLSNSLKQGKISHAYLFVGPRGCGKTSVARILAHEINGFPYELEDDYVDIIEIDGASNRGIDNIRDLREKVNITPTKGKYKVYIIDEVHMLTKEAFNALLKTLEEPPAHAVFIMATTDAYKVPITITSRAQTYTFKLADPKVMFDFLKSVATKEKIKIDDEALELIVRRGGGSFRDSLSLLDQITTMPDEKITKQTLLEAMGMPEDEKITKLFSAYLDGDAQTIIALVKDLLSSGTKPEVLVEEMVNKILAEPKPELIPLLAKLPEVKPPFAEAKLVVALAKEKCAVPQKQNQFVSQKQVQAAPQKEKLVVSQEEKPVAPQKESPKKEEPKVSAPDDGFDWNIFIEKVHEVSDVLYSQLLKTKHELRDNILDIYPNKKITKNILSRENNRRILTGATGGVVKITIHEIEETPMSSEKDEVLVKFSDIMGGEVVNDGGGSPF